MSRTVLVTGAAGFIGAALSTRLLQRGDRVVGLDSTNDYYDPSLKQARLEALRPWDQPVPRFEQTALEGGGVAVAVCRGTASGCGEYGGPGWCALFA